MTQKLCRRLEDLEKIAAAAAASRSEKSSDFTQEMELIMQKVHAWHADPVNQEWLAAQPPDYLYASVEELRAELWQKAYGGQQCT